MNWQARPQRFGSDEREMPQSVQRSRAGAGVGAVEACKVSAFYRPRRAACVFFILPMTLALR